MKVHATLRDGWTDEQIDEVIRVGRIQKVNMARARHFGVISGETNASSVEEIQSLAQVDSVTSD